MSCSAPPMRIAVLPVTGCSIAQSPTLQRHNVVNPVELQRRPPHSATIVVTLGHPTFNAQHLSIFVQHRTTSIVAHGLPSTNFHPTIVELSLDFRSIIALHPTSYVLRSNVLQSCRPAILHPTVLCLNVLCLTSYDPTVLCLAT